MIQQFSQAFAAGAGRVDTTSCATAPTTRNRSNRSDCCAPTTSRRPAFDAYRTVTTYLRDFKGVAKQQIGGCVGVHLRSRRADDDRALDVGTDAGARTREGHRAGGVARGRAWPGQPDQSGGWRLCHRVCRVRRAAGGPIAASAARRGVGRSRARRLAGWRSSRRRHRRPLDTPTPTGTNTTTPQPDTDYQSDARTVTITIADRHPRSRHPCRDCALVRHSGRDQPQRRPFTNPASGRARKRPDLCPTRRRRRARRRSYSARGSLTAPTRSGNAPGHGRITLIPA